MDFVVVLAWYFHGLYRTFGVCDLTFPARARDPWTLPMFAVVLDGVVGVLVAKVCC